ncbi:hypothetical protein Syun_019130 [Stephania yunnanensis]|uniref:Glycolipid transfer protein domain-containing protein n=1 Tax=Stephania yunnanensis TaxID=152371 RepID=A0AAP0ITI6_9MAGN
MMTRQWRSRQSQSSSQVQGQGQGHRSSQAQGQGQHVPYGSRFQRTCLDVWTTRLLHQYVFTSTGRWYVSLLGDLGGAHCHGGAQLVTEEPSLSRRSPALQSKIGVWPWASMALGKYGLGRVDIPHSPHFRYGDAASDDRVCLALQRLCDSDPVAPAFGEKLAWLNAYAQVRAPFHSWAVRTAAYAGMYVLPTRDELLQKLNEIGNGY